MTNKNARHYIADESIGGIEREYVEVERKADVGDYVINNKGNDAEEIYRVTGFKNAWALPSYTVEHDEDEWESTVAVSIDRSITLEPTDIVRIDGERYRLVDRHAEVGEKVIIVSAYETYDKYKNGDIITAEKTGSIGLMNFELATDEAEGNPEGYVVNGEYRVLESLKPVEESATEPLTVDETQASPQVIDMLANLARRVTQLEAQLIATQRNVETFAEQTETNSEDIRLLDERTTCDCTSKSGAELLADAFGALSRYEKRGDRQCGK